LTPHISKIPIGAVVLKVGSADPQGVKKLIFGASSTDKKIQEIQSDEHFENMSALKQ